MNREIVFILEPDAGRVTVESSHASARLAKEIKRDLGQGTAVNCARPISEFEKSAGDISSGDAADSDDQHIYLFRLYHDSTVDGPGRRSVIQVAGCSILCDGCYVPETHRRVPRVAGEAVKLPASIFYEGLRRTAFALSDDN